MDPDVVAAFFAGIGAVVSSGFAIWLVRRRADQECEQRLKAFREGLHALDEEPK